MRPTRFHAAGALAALAFVLAPSRASAQVHLTFEADSPSAQLIANAFVPLEGVVRRWAVCTGLACSTTVDPRWYFEVDGADVTKTAPFWLPAGDNVTVRARTGSSAALRWGTFFTWTGAIAAGAGAAFLGIHLAGRPIGVDSDWRTAGFWTLGSGAALIAIGLPLMLVGRTTVTTEPAAKVAKVVRLAVRGLEF